MKQIYFLRHFQTQYNMDHIISGRNLPLPIIDGYPLFCDNTISFIYCSPALRCRQTIEYFVQNKMPPIQYTDLLLERNLGTLQGHKRKDVVLQYPHLFTNNKFIVTKTPPNGECYDDFKKRIEAFWTYCRSINQDNILICSHNQTLKMLYFLIKNEEITSASWNTMSFPHGKIIRIEL